MVCKFCGKDTPDAYEVCMGCGALLKQESAPSAGSVSPMGVPPMGVPPMGTPGMSAPNAYVPAGMAQTGKKKPHYITLIGALIALVSVFLPFATVSIFGITESVSLFGAEGADWIIVIVGCIIGIVGALKGSAPASVVGGIVAIAIGFLENNSIDEALGGSEYSALISSMISKGAGCYALFIGGAVMILGGIIGAAMNKK